MEVQITEEIWNQCQKHLSYGTIDHLLRLLKTKKPHLVVQKYQFLQTQKLKKSNNDYYSESKSIQFDNYDEYFNDDYDYYGNKTSYKIELLVAVYFQVHDIEENIEKTLCVYFLEKNESIPHQKIMRVKNHVQGILRNDLILKIYDIFYLTTQDVKHYLVTEHELVYMKLQQYQQYQNTLNREEISRLKIKATSLLDIKDDASQYINFEYFVIKKDENKINIKLNPISSDLLNYYNNCKSIKFDKTPSKKSENQYQRYNQQMNEQQNQHALVLLNEIEEESYIQKENLQQFIQQHYPQLINAHNPKIFEFISQHPKYDYFQLLRFSDNYFIFKIKINQQKYQLKCEKFDDQKEAELIYNQYQQYLQDDKQILIPLNKCEIFIFEENIYLLVEEADFFVEEEHTKAKDKESYTLKQYISMLKNTHESMKQQTIQIIQQFKSKLDLLFENKLFNNNIDFVIINLKTDLKCYFTNGLFLKQHDSQQCKIKYCKHHSSSKMVCQFIELILLYFSNNFKQPNEYRSYESYQQIFKKQIEFDVLDENTYKKISPQLNFMINLAQKMHQIQEEYNQIQLYVNKHFEISIKINNYKQTATCIEQYDINDLRSSFIEIIQLSSVLNNSNNNVKRFTWNANLEPLKYEKDKEYIKIFIQRANFSYFQKLQQLNIILTYDQFEGINFTQFSQIQSLEDFRIELSEDYVYGKINNQNSENLILSFANLINLFQTKLNFKKIHLESSYFENFNNQPYKLAIDNSKTNSNSNKQNGNTYVQTTLANAGQIMQQKKKTEQIKLYEKLRYHIEKINCSFLIYEVDECPNQDNTLYQIKLQNKEQLDFGTLTLTATKSSFTNKNLTIKSIDFNSILRSKPCQNNININTQKLDEIVYDWLNVEQQQINMNILSNNKLYPQCWHDDSSQLQVYLYEQQYCIEQMTLNIFLCENVQQNLIQNSNYLGLYKNKFQNLKELHIKLYSNDRQLYQKSQALTQALYKNIKQNEQITVLKLMDCKDAIRKKYLYKLKRLVIITKTFKD